MSTKEDCFEEQKPEPVLLFDVEDKRTYVDAMNQHVSFDLRRKDCHQQMVRKPPDRARDTEHEHANHVIRHNLFLPTNSGSECAEDDTVLLDTRVGTLKFKQDQRDDVSEMSLS